MKNITNLLIRSLTDNFSLYLAELGFKRDEEADLYWRELDGFRELVEVQFDKRQQPKFVVNFGKAPLNGVVDSYGRHLPVGSVRIGNLVVAGRLYRFPFSILWFRVYLVFGLRSPDASVKSEVSRLVALFEQVLEWFRTGKVGSNLSISNRSENEPGARQKSMKERGVWPPDNWTEEDERALHM